MTVDVSEKVADNGQLSLAPEVVLKRSTVRAGKGETVASIARKYKVSAATVADWNKVSPSASFKAGQHVVVYLPAGKGHARTASAKASGKHAGSKVAAKSGHSPAAKGKTTAKKSSKTGGTKLARH